MIDISQEVYFFFDDSGVLHRNESSGHFVYAGYVFTSRKELDIAKRKYINANKQIRRATQMNGELKASRLAAKHRRSLFNVLKQYQSISVEVNINKVYDHILANKKSICRYKDYILKRAVKSKLQDLIRQGVLNKDEDINIEICVDEQLTSTNGYYDLRDSIVEELQHGITNWDYGVTHQKVFNGRVTVSLKYCESKKNYLIQASDILANRIWHSYKESKPDLRSMPNHTRLTFP